MNVYLLGGLALVIVGGALAWWLDKRAEQAATREFVNKLRTRETLRIKEEVERLEREKTKGTQAYEDIRNAYFKRYGRDRKPSTPGGGSAGGSEADSE